MPIHATDLPNDVIHNIAVYLNIRDFISLSLVNRDFHDQLQDRGTIKECLQTNFAIPQVDYQQTSVARTILPQLHLRREALRTARPYSVSLLAHATSFVFAQGVLCYTTTDSVRILDLRSPNGLEKVISSWYFSIKVHQYGTLSRLPPMAMSVVAFLDNFVTVVCKFGSQEDKFLFVVDVTEGEMAERCLLCERMPSTNKLFVVQDEGYLYYGTQSALDYQQCHPEWVLQGYNLKSSCGPERVTATPVQLVKFTGSDIGQTICFTIHKGFFYALSNQTGVESEEVNWTSYYRYVCFPVDAVNPDVEIKTIFRRQDNEGPINDRWTQLEFQVEERSGELLVVESRKEWLHGAAESSRTWYMEPWGKGWHGYWGEGVSVNPADPLARAVDKNVNQSRYEDIQRPRVERYTHREAGGGAGIIDPRKEYIRAKTKWTEYGFNQGCGVDFVIDDAQREGWHRRERMRLRVASRLQTSPLVDGGWQLKTRLRDQDGAELEDSEETYSSYEVNLWPRDGEYEDTKMSSQIDELICPGGKSGDVQGTLGEQGIVYSIGPPSTTSTQAKPLVFVCFDPSWGFEGMRRTDGTMARPRVQKLAVRSKRRVADACIIDRSPTDLGVDGSKRRKSHVVPTVDCSLRGQGPGRKSTSNGIDDDTSSIPLQPPATLEGGLQEEDTQSRSPSISSSISTSSSIPSSSTSTNSSTTPSVRTTSRTTVPKRQREREHLLRMEKATYLKLQVGFWLR